MTEDPTAQFRTVELEIAALTPSDNSENSKMTRILVAVLSFSMLSTTGVRGDELTEEGFAQFRKSWDEASWGPPGKRRGYMRPGDATGWKTRMELLQRLVKARDAEQLLSVLKNGTPAERTLAAQAIGYCGLEPCRQALVRAAEHDGHDPVRLYAVDALAKLGGMEHQELFRELAKKEKNRDVKRHLSYYGERNGEPMSPDVRDILLKLDIKKIGAAKVGNEAPDFESATLSGQRFKLSDYRGKKAVVLVFVYGDT